MPSRKRQQPLSAEDFDRALIKEVVEALNQQEHPAPPNPQEVVANTRGRALPSKLDRLTEEDAASALLREQWRLWWWSERMYFGEDMRRLAAGGRVRREVLREAVDHVKKLMTVEVSVEITRTGQANVQYLPRFRSWLAACSYALLRVSTRTDIRVGQCRKCGELFVNDRRGRGRQREGFCSAEHRNAYGQAQWRRKQRRAAPS